MADTGQLLVAFLVGSVGTVAGTLVAMKLLPLRSLGQDAWKVRPPPAHWRAKGARHFVR